MFKVYNPVSKVFSARESYYNDFAIRFHCSLGDEGCLQRITLSCARLNSSAIGFLRTERCHTDQRPRQVRSKCCISYTALPISSMKSTCLCIMMATHIIPTDMRDVKLGSLVLGMSTCQGYCQFADIGLLFWC